ncbi:hypothetical protein TetV_605 [Tetraselmis virus 1]|uniref:Uncharacterized protein n=1 Tax=Tetraselmis virus 1 TaxID=2060617 RepID=A0A2P0VP64_9VIRU|nr:hypothetical protein QJ968_gp449 [Tetraselmis virus 1]AUF82687.1 hypothetical protein TetV_605 [Tetraselmis virus 1]
MAEGNDVAAVIKGVMEKIIMSNPKGQHAYVSPDEVKRIITMINNYPATPVKRAKVFAPRYPDLVEQCPSLFQMACRGGMNLEMLDFMVNAAKDKDEEEGKEKVGQMLAMKYLKPENE